MVCHATPFRHTPRSHTNRTRTTQDHPDILTVTFNHCNPIMPVAAVIRVIVPELQKISRMHGYTFQESQVEEIARLYRKCFVGFNKSSGALPENILEDFGDPDIARLIPIVTRCVEEFSYVRSGREIVAVQKENFVKKRTGFGVLDATGEIVAAAHADVIATDSGVAAIGPVSSCQQGEGKRVFEALCARAEELGAKTLVLQQVSNNVRSYSLFAKCGFEAKHACHYVGGFLPEDDATHAEDVTIMEMSSADIDESAKLFKMAYGEESQWDREPSISATLDSPSPFPMLVARDSFGKLVGYSTGFYLVGHQIARSEGVLRALFAESSRLHHEKGLPFPRFHCPLEYAGIMTWASGVGLTVMRVTILMAKGPYDHAWPDNGYVALPGIDGW